jgi:hypothetical protein
VVYRSRLDTTVAGIPRRIGTLVHPAGLALRQTRLAKQSDPMICPPHFGTVNDITTNRSKFCAARLTVGVPALELERPSTEYRYRVELSVAD